MPLCIQEIFYLYKGTNNESNLKTIVEIRTVAFLQYFFFEDKMNIVLENCLEHCDTMIILSHTRVKVH